MHRKRVVVAVIFLPLFFFLVKYLPPAVFMTLVLLGILLGQYEFYRLCYPERNYSLILIGLLGGGLIWTHFFLEGSFSDREALTMAVMAFLTAVLIRQLTVEEGLTRALKDAAMGLFGILYVGWLLGHLILLRNIEQGDDLILYLFAVTWVGDTAAYYIGQGFGRRKLAPQISPNKTVEGAVGGLAASVAAAWAGQQGWIPALTTADGLVLGFLLGIFSQLGDLTESMFKRSAGVKDSGGLIPAHGGILDKVDGLIFTAPAFYYYLLWVKQYGRLIVI